MDGCGCVDEAAKAILLEHGAPSKDVGPHSSRKSPVVRRAQLAPGAAATIVALKEVKRDVCSAGYVHNLGRSPLRCEFTGEDRMVTTVELAPGMLQPTTGLLWREVRLTNAGAEANTTYQVGMR